MSETLTDPSRNDAVPRCQICSTRSHLLWDNYNLCKNCNRHVCELCWDHGASTCVQCSELYPRAAEVRELREKVQRLETLIESLQTRVSEVSRTREKREPRVDLEAEFRTCPNPDCKEKMPRDLSFCTVCGSKLTE